MGVQISALLPKNELEIEDLTGKTIAVDAFLWLHQFLSIIRQPDGTPLQDSKGRVTSHLSGIFYRSAKLMERNIKLAWVFDGMSPSFKHDTQMERRSVKEDAHFKWKDALERGDIKAAKKAAMATTTVNNEILDQSKKLLEYMGMPVVQALSEGESQCAYLCSNDQVYAVASQDSDSLLFNSPRLVRNLSITGKRRLPRQNVFIDVKPELIELRSVLKDLGITREQLIIMGLLVGTDFNPGIDGYGPKKSLALVKKEKTLKNVFAKVEWNHYIPAEEIYDFFLNAPVNKEIELKFGPVQEDKILKLLVDEHEFSQERVEKVIKTIAASKQENLGNWLK